MQKYLFTNIYKFFKNIQTMNSNLQVENPANACKLQFQYTWVGSSVNRCVLQIRNKFLIISWIFFKIIYYFKIKKAISNLRINKFNYLK